MSKSIDAYEDTFWIIEGLTKAIAGVLAYKFRNNINEYVCGIIGSSLAVFGFIFVAIAEYYVPELLLVGVIMIAMARGIWWVMAPLIAFDDAGQFSFGALFGTILTFNFWGMFIYAIIWSLVWDYVEKRLFAMCIISIASCGLSILSAAFSLSLDEKKDDAF